MQLGMSTRVVECGVVAAVAAVVVAVTVTVTRALEPAPPAATPLEVSDAGEICDAAVVGMWQRDPAHQVGDSLRFYYFHPAGYGLYRYGKVGLTNTHSFDYDAGDGSLSLQFRKTGSAHTVRYHLENDGEREWLVLRGDPREDAEEVRYFKVAAGATTCNFGPLAPIAGADLLSPEPAQAQWEGAIGGRLWGDVRHFKTGGLGFAIYQLQPQALDGRGVGWFHRGDYDEWTTETLHYRQRGDDLVLDFPLQHDHQLTTITRTRAEDDTRHMILATDPRDYWRPHDYADMGPTFAACQPSLP